LPNGNINFSHAAKSIFFSNSSTIVSKIRVLCKLLKFHYIKSRLKPKPC